MSNNLVNLVNIVPYLLPFDSCQTEIIKDDDSNMKFKCLSYKGFLDIYVRFWLLTKNNKIN
jgi:hypothetical protein